MVVIQVINVKQVKLVAIKLNGEKVQCSNFEHDSFQNICETDILLSNTVIERITNMQSVIIDGYIGATFELSDRFNNLIVRSSDISTIQTVINNLQMNPKDRYSVREINYACRLNGGKFYAITRQGAIVRVIAARSKAGKLQTRSVNDGNWISVACVYRQG